MKTLYTSSRVLLCLSLCIFFASNLFSKTDDVSFNLYCPDDVTVDCNAEIWDLSIYGNATYHDYYGYHDAGSPVVHYYLNSCGGGYITRKWTVEDPYWNIHTCTQYITVGGGAGFDGSSIVWPAMYVAEGCDPNIHPDVTGKPTWVPSECSMIGYNYTDKLYTVSPGCKKILRKWTLIDWCQESGGYNSNQSTWIYTQTIKIVESTPPVFTCIPDITVFANDCKWGKVTALPLTIDPATCGGNFEITNNSTYATEKKADLSGTYPVGTTKVVYTVKYACGSKKTCTVNVTVKPKAPTAICISSLSVALMGMDTNNDGVNDEGMVQIWAKDLNWKSETKCGYNPLRFSFSTDPNDMSKTFTCDHVGKNSVKMYVTDSKGGQSYCVVEIDVQNNGANIENCEPVIDTTSNDTTTIQTRFSASGNIKNTYAEPIKDISFELFNPKEIYKYTTNQVTETKLVRDSIKSQSGAWIWFYSEKQVTVTKIDSVLIPEKINKQKSKDDGTYAFNALMEKDKDYMLKCINVDLGIKNIDKNDIDLLTAYLLGETVFTESWQYIAADVDKNGKIDISDLNLLIQFVKGDINSLNDNEWTTILWNENISKMKTEILNNYKTWLSFNKVNTDAKDVNFLAIQSGDINKVAFVGNGNVEMELEANARERKDEFSLSMYPNPFTNTFVLKIFSDEEQNFVLSISDVNGKIVDRKNLIIGKGENIIPYDGSMLSSGLYFYQAATLNHTLTGKVIKSN